MNRHLDWHRAFEHPVTTGITITVIALLMISPFVILRLMRAGKIDAQKADELKKRTTTWLVLAVVIIAPILAGALPTIIAVVVMSLACFREYARATGLHRDKSISLVVILCTLALSFAALDHWYNFFMALAPLSVCFIAAISVLRDDPTGYIQRTALGIFAFMFFGYGFAHVAFLTNDPNYRPILLMLLLTVGLNDIFAYISGHLFGKTKLAPKTSPNKTLEGAVGALLLTSLLVVALGKLVFHNTALDQWHLLLTLGLIVGCVGQLGDLMLSAIKRDLGVKDLGTALPGHGGLLDRFDSLVLVAPVVFHFYHYYVGVAANVPTRYFTAG